MQDLTALLFSVHGRIGRIAFCVTWLIAMAFVIVPVVLLGLTGALDEPPDEESALSGAVSIIMLPAFVLSLWVQIAAYVKRLHDFGMAGIAAVLAFIPIVGLLIILGLMLRPGAKGRNEFGEPPSGLFDIGRPAPADSKETQSS